MLEKKSLHELRGIAQSYGIGNIFSKESAQLIQEIGLKQQALTPEPVVPPVKPEYDARLMTKPPAKSSTQDDVRRLLQPHIERGMHLEFPDPETWHITHGKRSDTGTIRMPHRVVLDCANKLMKTGVVRE